MALRLGLSGSHSGARDRCTSLCSSQGHSHGTASVYLRAQHRASVLKWLAAGGSTRRRAKLEPLAKYPTPHTPYINEGSHRPPRAQTRPCTLSAANQTAARQHAVRPAAPAALFCTLQSQAGRPARAAAQPGLQPCAVLETPLDARTCSATARPHDRHPPNMPAAQH